jgi:hypothetical protein
MNIKATIIEISESQQISDKFRKREFVVEYAENPQYPEFIKFELKQDKCDLVNDFTEGQEVEVDFNLKGRKWVNAKGETVYFNSLEAWKVKGDVKPHDITQEHDKAQEEAGDADDLPF